MIQDCFLVRHFELTFCAAETELVTEPIASTSRLPVTEESTEAPPKRAKVDGEAIPLPSRAPPLNCPGSTLTLHCKNIPGVQCGFGVCKRCCEEIVKEKKGSSVVAAVAVVEGEEVQEGGAMEGLTAVEGTTSCAYHDARAEKQSAKSAQKREKRNAKQVGRAERRKRLQQNDDHPATAT